MGYIPPLIVTGCAAFGCAVLAWPILRVRGRIGLVLSTIAATVVLLGMLLIPPPKVIARALAAVVCGELFFKMADYARQSRRGGGGRFGDYLRFLIPFPLFFLVVFGRRDRRLPPVPCRPEIVRIVLGTVVAAACFYVVFSGVAAVRSSFLLDHALKLVIFVVTIESASQAVYGLERLARFDTTPPMRFVFLARTPSDFWRRYNTRVHSWLDLNVFRPCGGARAPVRAVLATFLVSAIFHELMFDVATSRFDGYQFLFFMLQAPAVLISPRLERFARRTGAVGSTVARALTILWMATTSIFFFHGVERIFPFFYASEPWLP